jgi:hypothetical protein
MRSPVHGRLAEPGAVQAPAPAARGGPGARSGGAEGQRCARSGGERARCALRRREGQRCARSGGGRTGRALRRCGGPGAHSGGARARRALRLQDYPGAPLRRSRLCGELRHHRIMVIQARPARAGDDAAGDEPVPPRPRVRRWRRSGRARSDRRTIGGSARGAQPRRRYRIRRLGIRSRRRPPGMVGCLTGTVAGGIMVETRASSRITGDSDG